MILFVLAIILMLLALVALTLEKTYFYLPYNELKRLASSGNQLAQILFPATAYKRELKTLMWLITGLSAAAGFVLFARIAPPLLGFVVIVIVLWLDFIWIPKSRLSFVGTYLAKWLTPTVVRLLRIWHPIAVFLLAFLSRFFPAPHTGLFERSDWLDLIDQQKSQEDSRIPESQLELMRHSLKFSDYKVADIVIHKRHVKTVNVSDSLGPVLLDELHASGHALFPVYSSSADNIIGTFTVEAVDDLTKNGHVRDFFDRKVAYIHEDDDLEMALKAFHETHQHLLIVINSSNDYVGIITLKDVLLRLIGRFQGDLPVSHDDRQAVAARHSHQLPKTE
jgi:CBS domain containing-hemolysin-like protein